MEQELYIIANVLCNATAKVAVSASYFEIGDVTHALSSVLYTVIHYYIDNYIFFMGCTVVCLIKEISIYNRFSAK